MKRKLTFFSLTLMILLLGSMQTPAQFSDTLSENLTQTTYGWEVTIATGNTGDISEGDTIDYILDEAPAGMDWYEYLEIGVVVKANGIQVDIDADWSTYSDLEALSILFVLIWVFPVSEFTSFNGYTVDGNEAFDDYGCTYSMNSGILLEWDITEGPDRMVFEYREGGTYMAPVSPVFIIAGLVAIPIIRRKLN